MAKFRALLLGVAEYDDAAARDLPFVGEDIASLGAALEAAGYSVTPVDSGRLSRPKIMAEVQEFLRRSGRGDTLLIYLSGHGVHTGGVDYLVPTEVDLRVSALHTTLVPINSWVADIDQTSAGNVLFLIDACREGFDERTMTLRNKWGEGRIGQVARRNVAYLFACAPGQVARFVDGGGETFSVFARAVQQVVADGLVEDLEAFATATQEAMEALRREHQLPAQELRLSGETDARAFRVLARARTGARSPVDLWREHAVHHEVWAHVPAGTMNDGVRQTCVALVTHLSQLDTAARRGFAHDPWNDPAFATRVTDRVRFLVDRAVFESGTSGADGRGFSPAEAALIVALPFLYGAFWATLTARAAPLAAQAWSTETDGGDEAADFRRFAAGFPRLVRRMTAASEHDDAATEIRWWLLHRWIRRRAVVEPPTVLPDLLAPVADDPILAEVFRPEFITELLRTMAADPGYLLRTDRPHPLVAERFVAAGTPRELRIREHLLAYLLAVGHAMAIELVQLPEVLVEHLGIGDPVALDALRTTVTNAEWHPHGTIRVLSALCGHPAIDLALRERVGVLDRILIEIQQQSAKDATLAPLRSLPHRASADRVRAVEADGRPSYQSAGVRFRLAEDRVQELLMGEQLYGDPALAVRELYQNALDACRYRQARVQYLSQRTGDRSAWTGRIEFVEGVDEDGRAYLDCVDNGVGMGERELTEVFSQAGVRFADVPEFLEERAVWARQDPPIHIYPNSRFGIGVLSYFMLADEIRVDTCRYSRGGVAGDRLTVLIAGPGNLFRIVNHGPGSRPGTRVRLYLRSGDRSPSCVDLLRRLLWVAEFTTTATDGRQSQTWAAGQLSDVAPLGTHDPYGDNESGRRSETPSEPPPTWPSPDGEVWWCHADGAVLVDGIWLRQGPFGAVVNLCGRLAPRLSVDRKQILRYRGDDVDGLLRRAVAAAASIENPIFTFAWVARLTAATPGIADAVLDAAIAAGWRRWPGGGDNDGLLIAGCFPSDQLASWLPPATWAETPSLSSSSPPKLGAVPLWRATAWAAVQSFGPEITVGVRDSAVVRARPSDVILLNAALAPDFSYEPPALNDPEDVIEVRRWLDPDQPVPTDHLIAAAIVLGRGPRDIADRLTELGYRLTADPTTLTDQPPTRDDTTLISRDLDGVAPWLDPTQPVPTGHLVAAARQLDRSPRAIAERLTELGYPLRTDPGTLSDQPSTDDDAALISRDLTGSAPWLDPVLPVSTDHLVAAAVASGRSPREIAEHLAALGYPLSTDPGTLPDRTPTHDDAVLVSRDLDGLAPWLDPAKPIPTDHLIAAANRLSRSPRAIAERLTELGYALTTDPTTLPDQPPTHDDAVLISRDLAGLAPWLDLIQPVPTGHVMAAASELGRGPRELAERLTELGYTLTTDPTTLPDQPPTHDDAVLISQDLDGSAPWLNPSRPVPTGHVMAAARQAGRGPREMAERLTELGYTLTTDPATLPNQPPTHDDAVLISQDRDGKAPWLDLAQPVPTGHVMAAAIQSGRGPRAIAERLITLGYTLNTHPGTLPDQPPTREHAVLISRDLDGSTPWLNPNRPVSTGHLIAAASQLGRGPREMAERLTELGYTLTTDPATLPDQPLAREDATLISRDLDGSAPWLDPTEPIPPGHLVSAANRLSRGPRAIAERLTELGYTLTTDPGTLSDQPLTREDAVLISQDLDGSAPWLDLTQPVSVVHLIAAAHELRRDVHAVADRLEELGFGTFDAWRLSVARPGDARRPPE